MNEFQGEALIYLLKEIDMSEEEFKRKFDPSNIIDGKLHITLSDGSIHIFTVMEVFKLLLSLIPNYEEVATELKTQ